MDMSSKSHSIIWLFSGLPFLATAIVAAALVVFGPWLQGHRLEAAFRTGIMSDERSPTGSGVDSFAQQTMTTEVVHEEQLILVDVSKWELRSWQPEVGVTSSEQIISPDMLIAPIGEPTLSPDGKWLGFISSLTNSPSTIGWLWFVDLDFGMISLGAQFIGEAQNALAWLPTGTGVLVNQFIFTPQQRAELLPHGLRMDDDALGPLLESLDGWRGCRTIKVIVPPNVSIKPLNCIVDLEGAKEMAVWGKKVAYVRGDQTSGFGPTELCVYDMQSRETTVLTQVGTQYGPLCWRGDGRQLLFDIRVPEEDRLWLTVCDLDGKCTRLDKLETSRNHCWLGSSHTLVYSRDGNDLVAATSEGDILFETTVKLAPDEHISDFYSEMSSSSDGKHFTFGTWRSPRDPGRVCIYRWSGGQAQLVDTIQGSYTFRWCKVTPPTPSLLGTEHAGVRDREARVLINKYPALAAWFGFYNAMKADDIDTAWQFLCDDTGGSFQRLPLTSEMNVDFAAEMIQGLYRSYEVKAIKAGFAPEFGRVSQNSDANHFIIQGSWRLRSLNNFTLLLTSIKKREEERSHHIPETLSPDERGAFVAEVQQVELGPVVAAAKEPGEFRFVRIKGKWYYLPRGW